MKRGTRPRAHAQPQMRSNSSSLEPADRDRVELDRCEAGGARRLDAGQHARKVTPARDAPEALRVERIEADVDAVDTGRAQRRRQLGQQVGVGRQRDVVDARDRAQLADERRQVAAHGRLAAGEAHAAHAQRRKHPYQRRDLFERQHVGARRVLDAVVGDAVAAAVVAAVGHRHPQVVDHARLGIHQALRLDTDRCFSAHDDDAGLRGEAGRRRG